MIALDQENIFSREREYSGCCQYGKQLFRAGMIEGQTQHASIREICILRCDIPNLFHYVAAR
jgi:hypothetical protein